MIIQICPLFDFSTDEQWRALLGTIVIFSKQICFKIEKHEKCVFLVLVRLNVVLNIISIMAIPFSKAVRYFCRSLPQTHLKELFNRVENIVA